MVTKSKYNLESIMDDLGVGAPARAATLAHLEKLTKECDYTLYLLETIAGNFEDGYMAALKAR